MFIKISLWADNALCRSFKALSLQKLWEGSELKSKSNAMWWIDHCRFPSGVLILTTRMMPGCTSAIYSRLHWSGIGDDGFSSTSWPTFKCHCPVCHLLRWANVWRYGQIHCRQNSIRAREIDFHLERSML